jgi:hypothetical protein
MPQVKSSYDGAGGDYIKWMCGAGGRPGGAMASLHRGVGSLVRDISDPCLNPSPVKVAIDPYSKLVLLFCSSTIYYGLLDRYQYSMPVPMPMYLLLPCQ